MAITDTGKKKKLLTPEEQQTEQIKVSNATPPPTPQKPTPVIERHPESPQVIRNQDTGKVSGVKMPNGDTFLGRDKDIRALIENKIKQQSTPQGAVEATQVGDQKRQLQTNAPLAEQVGQIPPVDPTTLRQNQLNPAETQGTALAAGTGAAVSTGIGGAILAGAAAGTAVAPGVGTIAGAAIAAGIGAYVVGARSSMKSQLNENIATDASTLTDSKKNLRALITDTNAHPQNAAENLELFNHQLALIQRAHSQLVLDTNQDLNKWVGVTGQVELEKYANFYSPGGQGDYLKTQMQLALLNPDPSKNFITADDLIDDNSGNQ